MVLPTSIPPFTQWSRPGSTSLDRGTHGITPERQARKHTVVREVKETASLSLRRSVSYLTSKKANATRADKISKPHRAIKNINYARDLDETVHTQQKNTSKKIKYNTV